MASKSHPRRNGRIYRKHRTPPGSPPGTLIADPEAQPSIVHVMAYGPTGLVEQDVKDLRSLPKLMAAWPVTWINIDGLENVELIRALGDQLGLHRLALEDVVNLHQRAKTEDYGSNLYIVTHMVTLAESLQVEQMSLFLGKNFVLTFQYLPGDCLDPVRARLRSGAGNLRSFGADYLAYALLDAVLDGYFPVLEAMGERLENIEVSVLAEVNAEVRNRIHEARRDLLDPRRAVWPQREALNLLVRDTVPLIAPEMRPYFRDIYDHVIQIIDLVETYREFATDLTDLYLSSMTNRMNEIMKVLTVIATIFIPLSFIASLYGMNFNPKASPLNMPELNWTLGYPFALLLMILTAGTMLYYFYRRDWL